MPNSDKICTTMDAFRRILTKLKSVVSRSLVQSVFADMGTIGKGKPTYS